jgi:cytochrome c-type biogenesis protein CcmH/NrfG
MGGLSIWHWLVVLVFLGVPAILVTLLVLFMRRRQRAAASAPVGTTEARLARLDALRAQGLITQEEFDQQRAAVIRGL